MQAGRARATFRAASGLHAFVSPVRVRKTMSDARHIPVLLAEVLEALDVAPGKTFIDGTFGAGGYTRAILARGGEVLALDRDPTAIAAGQSLVAEAQGRLKLVETRFSQMALAAGGEKFDGIALDIGVSSMQFDEAERGFSFRFDGPLDMRMSRAGRSAADIVNETDETDLANLIYLYGEERASRRIAKFICNARKEAPILTTLRLAEIVARAAPARPQDIHPATKTFQALRIAVNSELDELSQALEAAERLLKPGGRLAVVTFHSLEDRIAKQFFAERSGRGRAASRLLPGEIAPPEPTFTLRPPQPVAASEAESRQNPRARSAKLRWAERRARPAGED